MLYIILFTTLSAGLILLIDWIHSPDFRKRKYIRRVSYSELIHQTMYYTGFILSQNNIKTFPIVDIRYYRTKKWAGRQMGGSIVIYIKSNETIIDIVDTVLHEISHYISMLNKCEEYKNYDKLLNEKGYMNHPEEIKARKFANVHLRPCINYLVNKGVIE